MQHLPEVLKLVEGGIQRDPVKVSRYVELLASKLDRDGDGKSAALLRKSVKAVKSNGLHAADISTKAALPVDAESRVSLAQVSYPLVDETQLVLDAHARHALDDFITGYRRQDELLSAGLSSPGHVLLHGPPGCGKTQAATYVAASLGLPLVTARLDGLISSFVGSTAKNLRALFEFVEKTPCVLFLDEFDAVAKMRDDPHELGELKRVVNSLLQNIDFLPAGTAVIAATNHEHLLDPAVWRRFEFHIEIGLPAEASRRALFEAYLPGTKRGALDLDVLAAISDGMTPATIQRACELMSREMTLERRKKMDLEQVVGALLRVAGRSRDDGTTPPWPTELEAQIRVLRERNSQLFTYDVISRVLGVSTGKISNVLREKAVVDA